MAWSTAWWVRGFRTTSAGLSPFAEYAQRWLVARPGEVGDIGVAGLGDPQAVEAEQAHQGVGVAAFILADGEETG
jgi:hypothetical protein